MLVLLDLAHEFGAMGAQARKDRLDVFDGEHDATNAQRVYRRAFRLGADCPRALEFRQLNPPVAVRGPHHGHVDPDTVEPDKAVHPASFDRRLALQLQTQLDKESDSGGEVLDNNADVVHPSNRYVPVLRIMVSPT